MLNINVMKDDFSTNFQKQFPYMINNAINISRKKYWLDWRKKLGEEVV